MSSPRSRRPTRRRWATASRRCPSPVAATASSWPGTLTLPPGPGPHPAVVLMSGSGAQDRDESLRPVATLKPFALIADALTTAGVAVLRYDDRGVGEQHGRLRRVHDRGPGRRRAGRARATCGRARTSTRIASVCSVTARAASTRPCWPPRTPGIAFVVGMAAPADDGVSVVIAQNEAILRAAGESEEEVDAAVAFATEAMPLARDGDDAALGVALRRRTSAVSGTASPTRTRRSLGDRKAFVQRQVESLAADLSLGCVPLLPGLRPGARLGAA